MTATDDLPPAAHAAPVAPAASADHPAADAADAADGGFAEMAALCERLAGFDAELSVHHVDGWLTAMAAGPVRLPSEQWLELAFGDTFERTFADPADRAQALAVLERRLVALHRALDAEALLDRPDDLRLEPYFDDWTEEDRRQLVEEGAVGADEAKSFQVGALWAEGVLAGLDALADAWQLPDADEFLADFEAIAEAVTALHLPDDEAGELLRLGEQAGAAPTRDDLLANACFAVQDLRVLLLDHGPRPPPRRVAPQPGRNDPCPCGSGKKFKKCHGAAA